MAVGATTAGRRGGQPALQRPRSLPGGRAAIGALLVIAAVFGVFAVTAGSSDRPSTSYVVATGTVDLGGRLTADDLRLEPVELPTDTAAGAFTSVESLVGAVALGPIDPGQLLFATDVLLPAMAEDTTASTEFSFSVERDHAVDGDLQSGEIVDVLATYTAAGEGYTEVVTRRARVTSIDEERSDTIATTGTVVLTLALEQPDEVLALAHAKETAAVTIVRATRSDPDDEAPSRYEPSLGATRAAGADAGGDGSP